jgi:DNA-directed RNA polymerase specialized sigma24 family protein
LLANKYYSEQSPQGTLLEVKKGDKKAIGEFVWQHQERFYCIAFMATLDADVAAQLTITAFRNALAALRQLNNKQLNFDSWEWLCTFIVDAVAQWHEQNSDPPSSAGSQTDPTVDGSATMDWETTVILGTQRVKRCINSLPPEQKSAFVLRHQLGLSCKQVIAVLNQSPDELMANLHRARVSVVKCLGRG